MSTCPICHTVTPAPLPAGEWCAACEAEWIVATRSIDPGLIFEVGWERLRDDVQAMTRAFGVALQPIVEACAQLLRSFADMFGDGWWKQRQPNPALAFQRRRRGHRRHGR